MLMLLSLATRSLRFRWSAVLLTLLSVVLSVVVVLGVEHVRSQVRESFTRTLSGVDLIVGARTGPLNLLLYSVFRIGSPSNNIRWETYQSIQQHPQVAWSIPLSLGDSHRGYRVLGTTQDYFEHFQYGQKQGLVIAQGQAFSHGLEVVLGAEVASRLGYQLNDEIVLAHGLGHTSFSQHDDHPFRVSGILAATGTPVDQTLHIDVYSMEAIHSGAHGAEERTEHSEHESHHEHGHVHHDDHDHHADHGHTHDNHHDEASHAHSETQERAEAHASAVVTPTPQSITAVMLGLKVKATSLLVQRELNQLSDEPLTAILPGVVLAELWQVMRILENTLRLVSALVAMASLLGLSAVLMALLRGRYEEMQLLRAIGAPAGFILLLVELEAVLLSLVGVVMGSALLYLLLDVGSAYLSQRLGLSVDTNIFNTKSLVLMLSIMVIASLLALVPAWSAYRKAA